MGLFDPQGLSSSPTSQSITNSGISAWAQPYINNYLNRGNALLNQGPTQFQNQVWSNAQGLQTPSQFAAGSDLANQAGQGQLSTAPMALNYGQQGSQIGQQGMGYGAAGANYGFNAGQNYANQATNGSIGAYMNPYVQQSLAPQLGLLNQQQQLDAQNINAKAVGQGAFGGNRATLAQGLNSQNYDLAKQQAIGQGYNTAFQNAQQAQQFGANLGLQGAMQGTSAGLQGLGTALQGTGLGLQGVQGAQQGYSGATQAGSALGNIGAQQGQFQLGALALQNQIANQQYNLPYQQLNFAQGLMSGLPVSSQTTQGYQAGQNPYLQGIGAAGALASYAPAIGNAASSAYNWATGGNNYADPSNFGSGWGSYGGGSTPSLISATDLNASPLAKGGEVKRYASGGIASINRKVLNDPTAYSDQTVNQGAQDNILGGVTKLLALDEIAKQKQLMQNQQAMQQPAKPPILAQLQQQAMAQQAPQQAPQQMAQAMPPQGVDSAQSNLPQQYAGGGIIAFDEGGDVPFPEKVQDLPAYLRNKVPGMDRFLNSFNFDNIKEQVNQGTNNPTPTTVSASAPSPAPAAATPGNGIVIHDTPKVVGTGSSGTPSAPQMPLQAPRDYGASGIDALTKKYEDMISGSEDFKESEKKAETSGLRNLFLNMMNPERGASFVSGLGAAGKEAQAGLDKSLEGIQARKDKQIGQLASLGLKGAELKTELQKLGITEDYYKAHYPLLAAQAKYYGAKGAGIGGAGIAAGSVGAKDYFALKDKYNNLAINPKSDPAFYASLPKEVQDALKASPGTPSYQRGLDAVKQITAKMMAQDINEARAVGAKKVPLSSIEE